MRSGYKRLAQQSRDVVNYHRVSTMQRIIRLLVHFTYRPVLKRMAGDRIRGDHLKTTEPFARRDTDGLLLFSDYTGRGGSVRIQVHRPADKYADCQREKNEHSKSRTASARGFVRVRFILCSHNSMPKRGAGSSRRVLLCDGAIPQMRQDERADRLTAAYLLFI